MLFDKNIRDKKKSVKSACKGKKAVKSSVKKFKVSASTGDIKYTKKPVTASLQKWTLVDYFDVWGNPEDGYEVNNLSKEFDDLVIADDATNEDLVDYLISIGYLTPDAKGKVEVEDMGDMIEFTVAETGEPLCRLEPTYDVTSSTKRKAKKPVTAAESYGWVVESWEAAEAYEMAAEAWGVEDINQQIVDCISSDELAACLAFIFRMNDFREWDERNGGDEDDEDEDEDYYELPDAGISLQLDEFIDYVRSNLTTMTEDDLYESDSMLNDEYSVYARSDVLKTTEMFKKLDNITDMIAGEMDRRDNIKDLDNR